MRAEVENIKEVRLSPDIQWALTMECGRCGTQTEKEIFITAGERVDITNSRGTCNVEFVCKYCQNRGTIDIESGSYQPWEEGSDKPIAKFECRNFAPLSWRPTSGLIAVSEEGTEFSEIEIEDGDWADYDDKAGVSVALYGVTSSFERC